jgi:hypothetical protein
MHATQKTNKPCNQDAWARCESTMLSLQAITFPLPGHGIVITSEVSCRWRLTVRLVESSWRLILRGSWSPILAACFACSLVRLYYTTEHGFVGKREASRLIEGGSHVSEVSRNISSPARIPTPRAWKPRAGMASQHASVIVSHVWSLDFSHLQLIVFALSYTRQE